MNLIRNILTTFSANVVMLALSFVSSILLARMLGPEGRGLLALTLLLPELARTFGLLGFEQANTVYAGLKPEGRRILVWQSAAIAGIVGSAIAVGGTSFIALGAPGFPTLVRGPLWLYVLPLSIVPGGLVVAYWQAILRGMNRIVLLNVVDVTIRVAAVGLIVLFVGWWRFDVAGAIGVEGVVTVATVLLLVALLWHVGVWGKPSFDRQLWSRTARFAIPAHCSTVMAYFNYRVDQFIIAGLLPTDQLGFYVIAVGLAERLWILTGAVTHPLLPHLTNSRDREPAFAAILSRHVMIWTGAATLLLFALAGVVVHVMYSTAFAPAVAPLRWLLPGTFMLTAGKVLVGEILAREKARPLFWLASSAALINVAANLILVPRMGISGAALASSISYSFTTFAIAWYYVRETGVPWSTLLPRPNDLGVYPALLGVGSGKIPSVFVETRGDATSV